MKLPSIQQIARECRQSFLRFPLVLSVAAIGTVAALIIVDYEGPSKSSPLFSILLASALGLPFIFGLALNSENRGWKRSTAFFVQGLGPVVLIGYAFTVPTDLMHAPQVYLNRFGLLLLAVSLFATVAPYIGRGQTNGFWQFNKTLAFRILLSALFSGVLFAGLAIAFAALDNLFGVSIPPRRYAELWILIVGIFSIWFFLAGVPEDLNSLESATDYPKVVKVLAQYVLLPLVLVYLVILYAYIGKIILQWNWPKGWVSGLILGFATTGMTAFLLLLPIRDLAENAWIRRASRWFHIILLPLVVVLFLAASQRVGQYGITEGRYILFVSGGWLAISSLYFGFSKSPSIKFLPISVCVIALGISCGPWGAFAISERSQVNRLETLLTRNEILANGRVQKAPSHVPSEDAAQISDILSYLQERHGYDRIQPWFATSLLQDSANTGSRYQHPKTVAAILGVEYLRSWSSQDYRWFTASLEPDHSISLEGYEQVLLNQPINGSSDSYQVADAGISYRSSKTQDTLTIIAYDNGVATDSVKLNLCQFADDIRKARNGEHEFKLPPDSLSIRAETEFFKVKLILSYFTASLKEGQVESITGSADILYSINRLKP